MTNPSYPEAVIRDGASGRLLCFTGACGHLVACRVEEVVPVLERLEHAVETEGLYAAGFVSYEAAPAFDASLRTQPDDGRFPLAWFGLFRHMKEAEDIHGDPADGVPVMSWEPSVTETEYARCLARIKEYIRDGHTYQVNYSYRLRAPFRSDPRRFFRALLRAQDPPYAAYVDTGDRVVCSASPELFFRLDGDVLESRPMKGTAARGLWFADDEEHAAALRKSAKDRAENVMIVDMVRNDIGRIAETGSVDVPELFAVERYPTVWQMTSTVRGTTCASLPEIFKALFPAASITGAPKARTMEIIVELETTPRRIYTGAIGYAAPGRRAQFNVAIRTVLVDRRRDEAEYGVGGGIVWDSRTESERDECRIKSMVLHDRRPGFDLLETMLWTPEDGFFLLAHHMKRLCGSAAYFGFRIDPHRVREELDRYASTLPPSPQRIRLLANRAGMTALSAAPVDPDAPGFPDTVPALQPVDADNPFLYHKTTNRRVYEDALVARRGAADVLLFNRDGFITESTIANVVVDIDGVLYTPPVHCGLLPGTYRAWLLENARIREREITLAEALNSACVYLINSVRGMHRIRIVPCVD